MSVLEDWEKSSHGALLKAAQDYLERPGTVPKPVNDAIVATMVLIVRQGLDINYSGLTWAHIETIARAHFNEACERICGVQP